MIDRRGFFKTLFAGAAAAVLPKPKVIPIGLQDALAIREFFRRKLMEITLLNQNLGRLDPPVYSNAFDCSANLERANIHWHKLGETIQNSMRTIRIVNPDGTEKHVEINAPASLS